MHAEVATQPEVRRSAGQRVPAVLLGGEQNALSVARSLAAEGVTVYAISSPQSHVRFSRACRWIRAAGATSQAWEEFLLGPGSDHLQGSVLVACSDAAIDLVIRNHERLSQKYILEEFDPGVRQRLLDKRSTYEMAKAARIPYPHYAEVGAGTDPDAVLAEVRLPILLKPLFAPDFARAFGTKCFLLDEPDAARAKIREVSRLAIPSLAMDFVPGSDEQLCSYTTYRTAAGETLFGYTKRVIRRSPPGFGTGCYHEMDWNEQVIEAGSAFFDRVGLTGFGNVEFKWDARDSQLKLIECNTRFTQANRLIEAAGLPLSKIVYSHLAGLPAEPGGRYREGLRLWYPLHDFRAFLSLRRSGELTAAGWLRSLRHPKVMPTLSWRDPLPTAVVETARIWRLLSSARR